MQLKKIISLTNANSRLRFLAMVRSLRATGCQLPIWVIPYNDDLFELPENCIWWEIKEFTSWLKTRGGSFMMRKYQCLLTDNYQYVDSDVIFLKNPEHILNNINGFIASCGHWHNPGLTYTGQSKLIFQKKTTTWQKQMFNAGQYACDSTLYSLAELRLIAENKNYNFTCLNKKSNDQLGINLLVFLSKITVSNLTLQPFNMQSTWAGDYKDNYESYWSPATMPYIIHWAGCRMDTNRPIDAIMVDYLDKTELEEWEEQIKRNTANRRSWRKRVTNNLRIIKNTLTNFKLK